MSSLSPERIVAGKLVALLLTAAPFLLLAVPMFGLASIYGGVSTGVVVIALAAATFHVVCLACAGLGASSIVARARLAAPLAMLFAGVPSFFFAIPSMIAMERFVDDQSAVIALPLLVSGGAVSAAFAVACLLLARDQVAPASAPRWRFRRFLIAFVLVGLPVIAAASLRFLDVGWSTGYDNDKDEFAAATLLLAALVMMVTAVLEVCVSDARPRAAGEAHASPRRRALLVGALASLGVLLAALVPQASQADLGIFLAGPSLLDSAHAGLLIVALWIWFGASAAALMSRMVRRPIVRTALALLFLFGLFVLPLPLHELRFVLTPLFGSGELPLGFTNPLIVGVEHTANFGARFAPGGYTPKVSLAASIVFFTAGSSLMLALGKALARGSSRPPTQGPATQGKRPLGKRARAS